MVHRRLRLLLQLRAEITKTAEEVDAEIERELHALAEQEALRRRRQFKVIAMPGVGLAIGAAIAAMRAICGLGGRKALVAGVAACTFAGATAVTLTLLPNHQRPPDAAPDPTSTGAPAAEPPPHRAAHHRSHPTPAQTPGAPEDETPVDAPDERSGDGARLPTGHAPVKVTPRRVVPRPLRTPLRRPLQRSLRAPDEDAPRQDRALRHLLPTTVFGVDVP